MATQRETFLQACKKMSQLYKDSIIPYLNSDIELEQRLGWDRENLKTQKNTELAEIEALRAAKEIIKTENIALSALGKEKFKQNVEESLKRNAELQAENAILRSENDRLKNDRYNLTKDTIGQEVLRKGK